MNILVSGLSQGMLIFLIASGLTLILGLLGVANFAHGAFFGVGAYFLYAVLGGSAPSVWAFALAVIGAGVVGALLGVVSERIVFRRLADMPPVMSLLGTFALLLVLQGAIQSVWGVDSHAEARPEALNGSITVASAIVPVYSVLIVCCGVVVAVALLSAIRWTKIGRLVLALAEDRYMAKLLGIRTGRITAGAFAVGLFLAGLGGALAAPTMSLTPDITITYIIPAFAVVIVGGFGSVEGTLVASVLLGLLQAALVVYAPPLAKFTVYLVIAGVLLVRPQGIFGQVGWIEQA